MTTISPGQLASTRWCGFQRVVSVLEIVDGSEPPPNINDLLARVNLDGRVLLRRQSELKPLGEPHRTKDTPDCRVPRRVMHPHLSNNNPED